MAELMRTTMVEAEPCARTLSLSRPVICIVGPTASGKSELAQLIAEREDGEIVSADSMQIYRGMDIGTGKVMPDEMRVPHYGLDIVEPGEPYSAALFQSYARACFEDIDARSKRSVLCGGTGFYIRAAVDDYRFPAGEQVDNPVREKYIAILEERGAQALWETLYELDPDSAKAVHPNNSRRVIRALELHEAGESYAYQRAHLASIPQCVPACFIGLEIDPLILRNRIDSRVDHMVENGLIDEVRNLLDAGFRAGITAPQAIGYKEIVAALDGEITLDEAIEQIKVSTHRYAKRQRSWFKHDKRVNWIKADGGITNAVLDAALDHVEH